MVDKIEKGSAVRLVEDFEHLKAGTVGLCNSVSTIPTDESMTEYKTVVWFMPSTEFQIYILDESRFELIPDDEAQAMGFEELVPDLPEDMKVDEDDTVLNYNFGE